MTISPLSTVKISCEFFPIATDVGKEKLAQVRKELLPLNCEYYSVTYGAGGSTQDRTLSLVEELQAENHCPVMPHLTCVASDLETIDNLLEVYQQKGVNRLMALRGDMPSGHFAESPLKTAEELVRFTRDKWGDDVLVYVAAYPEKHPRAPSFEDDFDAFVSKCNAGVDEAVTQYFFNADAYFAFVDAVRGRGIDIPIAPGIMPITNYIQLTRFSDACGAEIPRWIRKRLEDYQHDLSSLQDFGADVIAQLCEQLLEGGAPSLHFYSMNRSDAILTVAKRLHLID